jgi:hypothetical protein
MTVRRILPLAALLIAAGIVLAQVPAKKDAAPKEPAKPSPGSLEDTLEKALRNSADIKAAEAKVRDGEAELNRVRHQVLTKATVLHTDLNLAKRMFSLSEDQFARLRSADASPADLVAAQTAIEKHRGEVTKLEAELKSLRGEFAIKSIAFSPEGAALYSEAVDGTVRVWDAKDGSLLRTVGVGKVLWDYSPAASKSPAVEAPMAERIRKFLDTEVAFEQLVAAAKGDLPVREMATILLQLAKADIPIHQVSPAGDARWATDSDVKGKLPVAAVLQLAEDQSSEIRIVVRDYGLLITPKDRVPDGAVRAVDFWKGKDVRPKEEAKPAEKK